MRVKTSVEATFGETAVFRLVALCPAEELMVKGPSYHAAHLDFFPQYCELIYNYFLFFLFIFPQTIPQKISIIITLYISASIFVLFFARHFGRA